MMIKRGFTLIELLVAISIIAVLTAVLLPNFMGVREKAKDSQRIQDLTAVKNALRVYYNDHQSYPDDLTSLRTGLVDYMKDVESVDITNYVPDMPSKDGFIMTVTLSTSVGTDDTDSQEKCGVGTTQEGIFMLCAN